MTDILSIESITTGDTAVAPEDLSDDQRSFLDSNKDKLDDATAEKYGIDKPAAPYIPKADDIPAGGDKGGKGGDDDDEEQDDETIKLNKLVDKKVSGLMPQLVENRNAVAVDSYLRDVASKIPTAPLYRDAMLQTMKIPKYSNLSAIEVFRIVAGDELLRVGAAKERAAARKASSTRVDNSAGGRPAGGKSKDWGSASKDDFNAKRNEVLGMN